MPYTVKTKDGITIWNIPDELAPDSADVRAMVAKARTDRGAQPITPNQRAADLNPGVQAANQISPAPVAPEEPHTTAAGIVGQVNRALLPYAGGAALGAAAGAPIGGVGAVPGAAAGVAAVGLSKLVGDPIVSTVNHLLGTKYTLPTDALEDLMTKIGIPEPRTAAERVVRTASEAAAGAGSQVGLGQSLMRAGFSPATQAVGGSLASQPAAQIASGAGAGAASQGAKEAGAGPVGQLVAGLGGSIVAGAPFVRGRLSTPPELRDLPEGYRPLTEAIPAGSVPRQSAEAVPEGAPVAPHVAKPPAPAEALTGAELNAQAKKAAEGGFGSTKAREIVAQQAMPNPKTVEAAKRLGIEDYLQPDHVTTNQAYRELAQAVKSVPSSAARAAEIDGLIEVGERADRLIVEMGGRTDLSRLHEGIKNRIRGTVDELSAKSKEAYQNIETQIPKQTRGPATSILKFINQRAKDLDGAENLSPLEKAALKKLTPTTDEAGNVIEPTYALIDDVRKDIGAATKAKGPFADADTGMAKHLYQLIDNDQSKIAESAGLGADYSAAKDLVKLRKGFEDDLMALYGKHLDESLVGKLSDATMSLSRGDAERLAKIMKSIPEDMRHEVAASSLRVAFGKATRNGDLNFNTFSKWYEGLLANRQAHTALMVNLGPAERKSISDLYRVAKGVALSSTERIPTGRINVVKEELQGADNLLGNIYRVAKRASIGIPMEAATSSMGIPGAGIASALTSALTRGKSSTMRMADELISSPEFLALAKESASKPRVSPATARRLASSPAFRRFARVARLPQDPEQRAIWVMNAVRAENSTIQ